MEGNKKPTVLLLVLFIIIMAARFIHLGADPPKTLSTSMGYMSDSGGYVHNARNKTLYDRWETDNWNMMYVSPLPHYMTYIVFQLLGPGIVQMNLIPALFSCLILIFLYIVLKSNQNRTFALLGVLVLGVNYVFSMFSQIAVRVMPMIFFVILILYFLTQKRFLNSKTGIFFAGTMSFIAFTIKGTFLLILPSILLGIAFYSYARNQKKAKSASLSILLFFIGMLAAALLWLITIYIPHKETFFPYGISNYFWLTPHGYLELLKNFWQRPLFYFMSMPVITCLASIYLLVICYKFFLSRKQISLIAWICGFWIISHIIYHAVIYYRPARHFIPLILPLVLLAISALYDFHQIQVIKKPNRTPVVFFIFQFFWLVFAFSGIVILISRPVTPIEMHTKLYLVLGLSFLCTCVIFMLFHFWPDRLTISLSKSLKITAISILIIASAILNLKPYLKWALSARYDRKIISQDLGKVFDHAHFGGLVSLVLSLENLHEAHAYSTGYINRGLDFIAKYKISHLLLTTHAEEILNYQRDFPESMKKAKILARYPLWKTYVILYDLNPPDITKDSESNIYEGETFWGENGIPHFNPKASGKLSFLIEKNKQGSFLKSSAKNYTPGQYQVTFRLKKDSILPNNERLVRIYVSAERKEKALSKIDIFCQDFISSNAYQDFSFRLNLRNSKKLILHLFSTGKADLWFDKATIKKLKSSNKNS